MDILKAHGKCIFCNKEFSANGMSRHLSTHLVEKNHEGIPGKSFHVKIEPDARYGGAPYFLHLWIDGDAAFEHVDLFLRQIWLECCGHMSSFTNPKTKKRGGMWSMFEAEDLLMKGDKKGYERIMEDAKGEIPKSKKVKDVFTKGLKLEYDYDFGSTTKLQITVVEQYDRKVKDKIVLLSRNEPLEIMCEMCGSKPAIKICSVCIYDDVSVFCNTCATKHAKKCSDFADYAAMPIVNSPRMGVCGYDGGTIDVERDGVYVKK